jgi:hypothetical protein
VDDQAARRMSPVGGEPRLDLRGEFVGCQNPAAELVAPKNESSARRIVLPAECVRSLLAHRDRQAAERETVGDDWTEHGLWIDTLETLEVPAEGRTSLEGHGR